MREIVCVCVWEEREVGRGVEEREREKEGTSTNLPILSQSNYAIPVTSPVLDKADRDNW